MDSNLSETFISSLLKLNVNNEYTTKVHKNLVRHNFSIKKLTNKQVVIYDGDLLKQLVDTRKIIVHKVVSFISQKRQTHIIAILFEKYEKFLPGVWLITNKTDANSYEMFLKYIKIDFPCLRPKQAIVDYDVDMRSGLRSTFPCITFIPSIIHQMKAMTEKAIQTNTINTNRTLHPESYEFLRKFIALSFLPKDNIRSSYVDLVKECKANYRTYFELYIMYYNEEWMEKWGPETFCVYGMENLMNIFENLNECQQVFGQNCESAPLTFLERIKIAFSNARVDLSYLENGTILNCEDVEFEKKIQQTWSRLANDSITIKESLTILSNLLNGHYLHCLININLKEKSCNNNVNNEQSTDAIHEMTTENVQKINKRKLSH